MTDIADAGRCIQELRDRAGIARRISGILSDEEAAKNLEKHARDLEAQANDTFTSKSGVFLSASTAEVSAPDSIALVPSGLGSPDICPQEMRAWHRSALVLRDAAERRRRRVNAFLKVSVAGRT